MAEARARILEASDIAAGLKSSFERQITAEDVAVFADLSGDHNPLHTDESYARQTNYGQRVVHGAFQIALASAMAGMNLPGQEVVVGSMRCRFPSPLPFPSTVRVEGEVSVWLPHSRTGTVRVRVIETSRSISTAEIHVGFSLHEDRSRPSIETAPVAVKSSSLPVVMLTGAGSSIGPYLAQRLSAAYSVIGLVRSRARAAQLLGEANIGLAECDLMNEDWESAAEASLGNRPVYGLVHAAWPVADVARARRRMDGVLRHDGRDDQAHLEHGGRLA